MTQPSDRGVAARWLYAVKPNSWLKLLVPMILGQAIGVAGSGELSWPAVLVGATFTGFGLVFIVLLNDWGDQEVDRIKRELFPNGCSPKTIPDRVLGARPLLFAGLASGAVALAAALGGAAWLSLPWLGWMGVADMLLFIAYTLPPLRLNYRGGGELLEMIGVGVALPWFNAYAQSGQLLSGALWVLPGFALLSLASAIASGLSDEVSDRQGGKTTVVTRFGNQAARRWVERSMVFGALGWALGALVATAWLPWWSGLAALAVLGWNYRMLRRHSAAAATNAFVDQSVYKGYLHRGIWQAASVLALGLWLSGAPA